MSRTYTFTATTYGGRTANHSMYMNTMQAWSGGKRVGCWRTGSTDYYGAVSFIFNSGDLATVRGCTIESIKLSLSCSSTFAYSEELIYEQKVTDTVTDWTIPNYAHEVTVPRYGTVPIIDVTVLGVPDYGYVVGGYYRTYAYCDVTGGTLTVVTAETSKTITYNGNGGTSPSSTVVWGEGSWEGVVTTSIPTRTGYSFNGWNTQANGGGTSYQPADDITLTSDIILYAQWTALKSVLTGATNANITEATTVSWTNYGSFTNKLRFIFGSVDSGEISVSGSSYSYTIPSSWYNQITNSTSGTATVYLYTYANGTLIGSSSKTFTASVKSSVVPAIGSISATGVDLMWGLYLQGHSSVTISVSNCSAGSGATIASYSIQGHGLNYSENRTQTSASATSAVFTVSGSQTYTATITDSRGRTASRSVTITVTAYAAPAISSVTGIRCDSDGTANPTTGTSLKASATFTYSAVGSNTITSSLSYKKHTDQAYTQVQTGITSGATYIFAVGLAEISSSYDVQVEVTDTIGNTATYTIIVPPVVGISFGLKNDRARFGGPVEKAGLQVDWNADFKGNINIDGNLTGGGVVKTVNSTAPDANGNVNVSGGGGGGTFTGDVNQTGDYTQTGDYSLTGDATIDGLLDVTQRRCSATLSSVGWYRVLSFETNETIQRGAYPFVIDLCIRRAYNTNNNELHKVSLLADYNNIVFGDEVSLSNMFYIRGIRYTISSTKSYIDIRYSLSQSNEVSVDFTVHALPTMCKGIKAESLQSVADAPTGETVLASYVPAQNCIPESKWLLWTNSSPASGFAAQTVSVDLSRYNFVEIESSPFAGDDRVIQKFPVGKNGHLFFMYLNADTASDAAHMLNGVSRSVSVTTSGVTFGNGMMVYSGGAYVGWTNRAIPTRIWGIK